jgi:uncharacterized membrane protein
MVALLWLLFGGAHVGLAARPLRRRLVARLGEAGFVGLFSLVAATAFTLLVRYYAAHRWEGAPGPAFGEWPTIGLVLMAVVVVGAVFVNASIVSYWRSPYALFAGRVGGPHGVERITRHPMFAGVALLAFAHTLLATRLVGAVFMAGFALLAVAGAWHQDRKLGRLRGPDYSDYLRATSAIPFAAVLAGRQRLVWRELPGVALATGVGAALWLRRVHGANFSAGGARFVILVLASGTALTLHAAYRGRQRPTAGPLGAKP